jgi:hypothetical protein
VVLLPVAAALVGAAVALNTFGAVPVWLPFVLIVWLLALPAVWLSMQSVRTSSYGIAAGRPWRRWKEIPWTLIERIEKSGPGIRIIGSNGTKLTIVPALLRAGGRLKRQLYLRLPPHVLEGALAQEAQRLLSSSIAPDVDGGLSGTLNARPRLPWRIVPVLVAALALAGAVLGWIALPLQAAIPLSVLAAGILQKVLINEKGISVVWPLPTHIRELAWSDVELIEHWWGQTILRLHGPIRIRCAGPMLFNRAARDLMRAFLHEYCLNRGVPVVRREGLPR